MVTLMTDRGPVEVAGATRHDWVSLDAYQSRLDDIAELERRLAHVEAERDALADQLTALTAAAR